MSDDRPRVFGYVNPDGAQREAMNNVNDELEACVIVFTSQVPDCPERTLALRKLEEAGFFANKAISRRGQTYLPRGGGPI